LEGKGLNNRVFNHLAKTLYVAVNLLDSYGAIPRSVRATLITAAIYAD